MDTTPTKLTNRTHERPLHDRVIMSALRDSINSCKGTEITPLHPHTRYGPQPIKTYQSSLSGKEEKGKNVLRLSEFNAVIR